MKDKNGETPYDLVNPADTAVMKLMRKARAQASVSRDDVASGASLPLSPCHYVASLHSFFFVALCADPATHAHTDSDGEPGSGSGSE